MFNKSKINVTNSGKNVPVKKFEMLIIIKKTIIISMILTNACANGRPATNFNNCDFS